MTQKQRKTLLSGLFFIAFGIFVLISAKGVEVMNLGGDLGSAFFPNIVGGLVLVCGLIVVVSSLLEIRQKKPTVAETDATELDTTEIDSADTDSTAGDEKKKEDRKSVALGFGCFVLYAILLKPVGFILSSILFLLGMMNVMSPEKPTKKNEILWLIISVVVPVVVYVIFVYLLNVTLPAGILNF